MAKLDYVVVFVNVNLLFNIYSFFLMGKVILIVAIFCGFTKMHKQVCQTSNEKRLNELVTGSRITGFVSFLLLLTINVLNI